MFHLKSWPQSVPVRKIHHSHFLTGQKQFAFSLRKLIVWEEKTQNLLAYLHPAREEIKKTILALMSARGGRNIYKTGKGTHRRIKMSVFTTV